MSERNKKYDVKITETAWEMLLEHARFLANVSVPAANRLIDAFAEITGDLAIMPERNTWLSHEALPFQKYRKLQFAKHYLVLYQLHGSTVYVIAVVDCRQDYAWLL